jgi:hypothetical protein
MQNGGKTSAELQDVKVFRKLENGDSTLDFSSKKSIDMGRSPVFSIFFDFSVPFRQRWPKQIPFVIHMTYKNDSVRNKSINITWVTGNNSWQYL